RHEEQAGILPSFPKPAVVECSHKSLARAGCGNHEVPVTMMPLAFDFKVLEHLALERPRLRIEMEDRRGLRDRRRPNGAIEAVGITGRDIELVVRIRPVAFKGRLELSQSGPVSTPVPGGHSTRR